MAKTLTTNWQNIASYTWDLSSYSTTVIFYLDAKYSTQNIESNKTFIDVRLRSELTRGWVSGAGYNYTCSYCPTVSGSDVWNFATETITSKSNQEIQHNPDGTKTLTLSATIQNTYWGLNKTISGEVILPTIPRASSVSCSSPYIGDAATIVIDTNSSSFTHTLTYQFGSKSDTIATKTNKTTVSWDTSLIKDKLYAQIPNAQEGSGTITCHTYSGDTLVGTKTCTFSLYAKKSECTPDVSGTVIDTNATTIALTGDSSKLIRYMSKPKITISATAKYSSSIKSYSINVDGKTINASSTTLSSITSNQITINATDSRKYDNPKSLTPEMVSYIKLTSSLTITRPEQTSSEAYLNGSGQWFNGSFSSSNVNTLTITCQYRKSGTSTWTNLGTLTPTISGNTFRFSNLKLGDSFDYKEEYQFKITIADKLDTIGDETKDLIILSVGTPVVRIGKDKININGTFYLNGESLMESGSWTPRIEAMNETAPTVTYTWQRGEYIKIGNLVYINFTIRGQITKLNGTNNYACIKGFPYNIKGVHLSQNGFAIGDVYNIIEDAGMIDVVLAGYNDYISILNQSGKSATKLKITPSTAYFNVGGSGCYMID